MLSPLIWTTGLRRYCRPIKAAAETALRRLSSLQCCQQSCLCMQWLVIWLNTFEALPMFTNFHSLSISGDRATLSLHSLTWVWFGGLWLFDNDDRSTYRNKSSCRHDWSYRRDFLLASATSNVWLKLLYSSLRLFHSSSESYLSSCNRVFIFLAVKYFPAISSAEIRSCTFPRLLYAQSGSSSLHLFLSTA